MYLIQYSMLTLLQWNLLIAVAILGSLGDKLNPVPDLGHPGIHAVAGAFTSIAHDTDLRESKIYQV